MKSQTFSTFVVGILTGVLIATTGFSLFQRGLQVTDQAGMGAKTTVFKLGHSLDQKHPVHRAMEFMADRLREKSSGTVELQIFPNGMLGSETECIEQLQHGALAMMKTSTATLESFVPEIAVFGVPYVFRDEEHFWKCGPRRYRKATVASLRIKGAERALHSADRHLLVRRL